MERPDLILAAADGYRWEHVRPFVESLRRSDFAGEVHFYGVYDPETAAKLGAAGVTIVKPRQLRLRIGGTVWGAYRPHFARVHWHVQPFVRHLVRALALPSRDRREATARVAGALGNIEVARFFWFYRFLHAQSDRYRFVMLTDVRDVLFLGNPFDFDVGDTANYFLEKEGSTLGTDETNRSWIHHIYGDAVLEELADRPVSCSGITIGTSEAVLAYLAAMVDELAAMPRQWMGTDQSAHNVVVHRGKAPGRLVENSKGPVLTIASMTGEEAHALVESRAHGAKVVHQYDRHPTLAPLLEALTGVVPGHR